MNATALNLTGASLARGLSEALSPARVDATVSLRNFAGIHERTYAAIGRAGSALTTAAYGHGFYAGLSVADIEVLARFVSQMRADAMLIGIAGPDTATDVPHHINEDDARDQVRL